MTAPDGPELINNVPAGPESGQNRTEVVQGFFDAMLAYPQTATVAREFLTPKAAATWRPEGLHVYDGQGVLPTPKGVSLLARPIGSLDERGSWTSFEARKVRTSTDLRLMRKDGQWRIVNPPAGTYVNQEYFDRYYDAFSLYFFDPTRRVLTPDPVYLLLGETTATQLVAGLLQGPTKRLSDVLSESTPGGTGVDLSVSTSEAGVAEVPLTDNFLQLSEEDRQLFAAQITWTLRQIAEIERISLTVDGSTINVPGVGPVFGVDEFSGFDPAGLGASWTLFAQGRNGVVSVDEEGASPVTGLANYPGVVRSAAVDARAALAALVVDGGRTVVVDAIGGGDEEDASPWFTGGTDLLKPSWDVHGVLWLVDRTSRGARIWAVTQEGRRAVRAPGLAGATLESFAVSRDGVRMVAIVSAAGMSRLVISLIDRDPGDPTTVSLRSPHGVFGDEFELADSSQVAWSSPTSVAVLGRSDGSREEPVDISIDGSSQTTTGGYLPARPVSIAAGPNEDAPVAYGTANGRIYVRSPDSLWVPFGGSKRLTSPFYPG
ncbi:MAG: LpqB family beta-propeller domain-containing protein [Nocardioidaceae bacterium]